MKVTKLESFPANANAFKCDAYNMGILIGVVKGGRDEAGSRIFAMMRNFPSAEMDWVIIVNEETGERIRIDFDNEEHPESEKGIVVDPPFTLIDPEVDTVAE